MAHFKLAGPFALLVLFACGGGTVVDTQKTPPPFEPGTGGPEGAPGGQEPSGSSGPQITRPGSSGDTNSSSGTVSSSGGTSSCITCDTTYSCDFTADGGTGNVDVQLQTNGGICLYSFGGETGTVKCDHTLVENGQVVGSWAKTGSGFTATVQGQVFICRPK